MRRHLAPFFTTCTEVAHELAELFLWESESPWRVDDVHGRSLRDSLTPCTVAAHSLLQLNIIPPSLSDGAPIQHCVHLVSWKTTPRTSSAHLLTTSPRLPDSDRSKTIFVHRCCCQTRTKESKHVCTFLGSLTRLLPTAMGRALWIAFEGTGVSTGGRARSSTPFFAVRTKESSTCVHFLRECLALCTTDNRPCF